MSSPRPSRLSWQCQSLSYHRSLLTFTCTCQNAPRTPPSPLYSTASTFSCVQCCFLSSAYLSSRWSSCSTLSRNAPVREGGHQRDRSLWICLSGGLAAPCCYYWTLSRLTGCSCSAFAAWPYHAGLQRWSTRVTKCQTFALSTLSALQWLPRRSTDIWILSLSMLSLCLLSISALGIYSPFQRYSLGWLGLEGYWAMI